MNQMNTGNAAAQIDGERIAKAVAVRSQALDEFLNEKRTVFSWKYIGLIGLGGVWGWFVTTQTTSGPVLVGIAAGIAFFIAPAAFVECIKLRRRLEAVIALMKGQNEL